MKIKEGTIKEKRGRNFSAVLVCEYCGDLMPIDTGYNSDSWHNEILPTINCVNKDCLCDRAGAMSQQVLLESYITKDGETIDSRFGCHSLRSALNYQISQKELGEKQGNNVNITIHKLIDYKGFPCKIFVPRGTGNFPMNTISPRTDTVIIPAFMDHELKLRIPTAWDQVVLVDSIQYKNNDHKFLKPILTKNKHSMFGGCFAYSSDSRFPFPAPIKIHDRVES